MLADGEGLPTPGVTWETVWANLNAQKTITLAVGRNSVSCSIHPAGISCWLVTGGMSALVTMKARHSIMADALELRCYLTEYGFLVDQA